MLKGVLYQFMLLLKSVRHFVVHLFTFTFHDSGSFCWLFVGFTDDVFGETVLLSTSSVNSCQ